MSAPMLIPFLTLTLGIVASRGLVLQNGEAAVALALSIVLALAARRWAGRVVPAAVGSVFLWLGASVEIGNRNLPAPRLDAGARETIITEGCVVESPAWSDDHAQFVLELAPRARARMNLYLRKDEPPPDLRYGQRVEVDARFRVPRNFENPGAFDYAGYLARRDVFWLGSITGAAGVRPLPGACGSSGKAAIIALRTRALRALDQRFGSDPYVNGVLRAALLGDGSHLDPVWSEEFRRTSTYHVLVVSGLHVTTLSAVILLLFRIFPGHALLRFFVTSALVWLYALLCGGEAPVVRAAAGTMIFLLGGVFHRQASLVNLLALTGFFFLCADPQQLFEASFQLSFLAVGILGIIAGPLTQLKLRPYRSAFSLLTSQRVDFHWPPAVSELFLEIKLAARFLELQYGVGRERVLAAVSIAGRVVAFLAELTLVSTLMQAALTVPMILFFHRAPVSGFLANLIVTPLMTWAVPAGTFALLTGFPPFIRATEFLVRLSHSLAGWMSSWDPAYRIPDAPTWLVLAASAALAWMAVELQRRRGGLWQLPALLAASLLMVIIVHPFQPQTYTGSLEMTAVDVSQGDSLLLVAPGGETMLIDGGGLPRINGKPPRLDIGEGVVSPYLWSRGFRHLDIVALTHADQDHIGGLEAVLRNFKPRELWVSAVPDHVPMQRLLETARQVGVRVVHKCAGDRLLLSGAEIEVLAPEETHIGGKQDNDASLVLRARFGRHAFLLTGDAERREEYELTGGPESLRADVLKLGHHGSKTSTTALFLDAVHPTFAVISAGQDNQFRHPHDEVLERLAERGVRVLRTDQQGLVTVRTDGNRINAETQRWPVPEQSLFSRQMPF
ncbi:MAG: DNA internalization-related competence protein ComEC/Rec2 [Acidobacteriota bacterium]